MKTINLGLLLCSLAGLTLATSNPQTAFEIPKFSKDVSSFVPRIDYSSSLDVQSKTSPPKGMKLYPLHKSGSWKKHLDLTFFADGYTKDEEDKFVKDAQALADDIIAKEGSMGHVAHLLNIYGVFTPSQTSGIGDHDTPKNGSAFGLYRNGPELRGVYIDRPKVAKAACDHWRERGKRGKGGGCDQAVLLGNDPLYGGLGGTFTVITSSTLNGGLVLHHELGHSLIPVGEEYDGGYVYSGVNAEKVKDIHNLSWKKFLTNPDKVRIEDVKRPFQDYPWYDLSNGRYTAKFKSSNSLSNPYPKAFLQTSLSSIPYPSHISFRMNDQEIDLSPSFPGGEWEGSKDRRWIQLKLEDGLPEGDIEIVVELTEEGKKEEEGQGGKMITSLEFVEYGTTDRFNGTEGFIGAFPTYDLNGKMTLRPTNEGCLMRLVTYPKFCSVCAQGLLDNLKRRIRAKTQKHPR